MGGGDKQTDLSREVEALFSTAGGGKAKRVPERFVGIQGTAKLETFEAWWRRAAKGDEFTYCEALEPLRDETWHRVGEVARSGYLRTHERRRAGGGKSWYAVRTGKALTAQLNPVEACLADPATDIIFRALKRAANLNAPCPTDTELAGMAGLDLRQKAAAKVRKLVDVGLVSSQQLYEGGVPSRVVTIVASGRSTAMPKKWAALRRAAERDARAEGVRGTAEPGHRAGGAQ